MAGLTVFFSYDLMGETAEMGALENCPNLYSPVVQRNSSPRLVSTYRGKRVRDVDPTNICFSHHVELLSSFFLLVFCRFSHVVMLVKHPRASVGTATESISSAL